MGPPARPLPRPRACSLSLVCLLARLALLAPLRPPALAALRCSRSFVWRSARAGGPPSGLCPIRPAVVPLRGRAWSRPSGGEALRRCAPALLKKTTFCRRRQNDTLSFCKLFRKNTCHFDIFAYLCGIISAHCRHVAGTALPIWFRYLWQFC